MKQTKNLYELAKEQHKKCGTFIQREKEINNLPPYLIDLEEIDGRPAKEVLTELLNQDRILTEIIKKGISQKKLEEILDADLFTQDKDIKEVLDILKEAKNLYVKDNAIAILTDYFGESDERGWDIRVMRKILHIINNCRIYTKKLPYYYIYEDFPGGQTYWHKDQNLTKIIDVEKQEEAFIIKAKNELGNTVSIKLTDYVNFGFEKNATKTIEEIIEKNKNSWLSYGNLNPIPMNISKQGSFCCEGTYPFSINYKIDKKLKEGFVFVVKTVDALKYYEQNNENYGLLFDPQFEISIYKINLKEKNPMPQVVYKINTPSRNLPVPVRYVNKNIFFALPLEMILNENSVGVRIKFKKSTEEWETQEYKTIRK